MNDYEKSNLYKLLRDNIDVIGSSKTTVVAMKSLIKAFDDLECDPCQANNQIVPLIESIKSSKPKVVPLIHLLEEFEEFLETEGICNFKHIETIKRRSIKKLESLLKGFETSLKLLIKQGAKQIEDGDLIIVHSVSNPVIRSLFLAKKKGKTFKVLILEQNSVITRQILTRFQRHEIDYEIIPEYSLSHYISVATKMFVGAIALTSDRKVITAIGSASVASMCHLNKVPVYLFINSIKFAHEPSKNQDIHRKKTNKSLEGCKYCLTSYSHDDFDLDYIDHLIIESGEIDKSDIKYHMHKDYR